MKTLQNNFTTPEQSKRLIELGVPVDSADCYFYDWDFKRGQAPQIFDWYERNIKKFERRTCLKMYPCWSVGRLMEIIDMCSLGESSDPNTEEYPSTIKVTNKLHIQYIEYLVKTIERGVQLGIIDFSKL